MSLSKGEKQLANLINGVRSDIRLLHDDLFNKIDKKISKIKEHLMTAIDDLAAKVAAEGDAVDSVITLLQGLKAQLDAAGTDPAKLTQLSADIDQQTAKLASAVTANTPTATAQPEPDTSGEPATPSDPAPVTEGAEGQSDGSSS